MCNAAGAMQYLTHHFMQLLRGERLFKGTFIAQLSYRVAREELRQKIRKTKLNIQILIPHILYDLNCRKKPPPVLFTRFLGLEACDKNRLAASVRSHASNVDYSGFPYMKNSFN